MKNIIYLRYHITNLFFNGGMYSLTESANALSSDTKYEG